MDSNNKQFTASDIEKYHRGQLSNKEMHDLEKAAMDDPFLADALEGYAVAGVNAGGDIADLKKRLAEKLEGAKVIPMHTAPRNSFKMLRVAILLAFIAGAGLLVYQFGFNKKSDQVAQAEKTEPGSRKENESVSVPVTNPSTTGSTPVAGTPPAKGGTGTAPVKDVTTTDEKESVKEGKVSGNLREETVIVTNKPKTDDGVVNKPVETQPAIIAPPVKTFEDKNDFSKVAPGSNDAEKKELAKRESNNKLRNVPATDKDFARDQAEQNNRNAAAGRQADNNQYNNTNIFRGRVTDAENVGLPFANVTNVQDNNAGTYTDARGYFNLTYPDSVLNVQVRSLGFENSNVQLRNSVANNQVILQDDRKSLSEVVLSKQKPNATARKRDGTMKLEEPEPADGWDNYDTYLANNLNVPEDFKTKPTNTGAVEVSFEVDKNGEPISIKVEKSLCKPCDKEAIRLIKEGPKWKRKARKGRTTVTIYF